MLTYKVASPNKIIIKNIRLTCFKERYSPSRVQNIWAPKKFSRCKWTHSIPFPIIKLDMYLMELFQLIFYISRFFINIDQDFFLAKINLVLYCFPWLATILIFIEKLIPISFGRHISSKLCKERFLVLSRFPRWPFLPKRLYVIISYL